MVEEFGLVSPSGQCYQCISSIQTLLHAQSLNSEIGESFSIPTGDYSRNETALFEEKNKRDGRSDLSCAEMYNSKTSGQQEAMCPVLEKWQKNCEWSWC